MVATRRKIFEDIVIEAWKGLPASVLEELDNVQIVIEAWPTAETLRLAGVSRARNLLGFYQGIPQRLRTMAYNLALPDKITIFQRPIEMRCSTMDEVRELVRRVVRHELAHHFGLDDDRLRDLGAY